MNGRARMLLSRANYLTRKIAEVDETDRRTETWRKDRAACVEGAAAIVVVETLGELDAGITFTLDVERANVWKLVLPEGDETAREPKEES